VAQPAPSDKFVGPMPAIPVTEAPVRLVVQPAPSTQFVGPMPLQPVPLAGYGEAGHLQPGQGQPGMWQSDIDGAAATSDGLPAMKGEKSGGGGALDQVKIRQQVGGDDGFRRSLGTENGKMDSASVSGMTQRDVRLYAEQTSAAGSQPSSGSTSSGSSSSSQSSAGQSASAQSVAAAGGQGGGQTGGQNQSGQGGGQSAAQGFADASPSRDVADRTMLHRLNTANAAWSETMIKRLTSDLRSGVQTVRIILEPRHLGRLNVDLGLRNGKASIRIAAETAEAAKLLGSARGQLGQMLEQSGMRLASFQTSSGGQDAAMDGNGGQQGHAQSGADGKNTGRDQGFSNKVIASDSEMRQADDSSEGQDLALREGETAVLSVLA
ncbi:MAG: flagellar hook-length control protein FliK, partial [Rhodobiaceae bacterium]